MEKQTVRKVGTFSFLSAAVITYVAVNVLFKSMAGAFGIIQRWYSVDIINHGLPILSAATVFFVLQFNPRVLSWAEEVILEVSKVVWPSRRDTFAMSIVVCMFVGVACVLLVAIDFVARHLIQMIIN